MPETLLRMVDLMGGATWVQLLVPAVVFTLIMVVAKGPRALRLSDETLNSVRVTITLLLINGLVAPYLLLNVGLESGPWGLVGLPHVGAALWDHLPWPVTLLGVLLMIDFVDYWSHRLMHGGLIWGIHAIHHSEQHMTWVSTYRVHVLEAVVMQIGYIVLLGWIDLPVWAIATALLIGKLYNHYVHLDTGWNHGPLAKLLVSPNLHRWHHSVEPVAFNQNYANIFSAYDVLFGTYYNPSLCTTDVGASDFPNPGVLNQLVYPFVYMYRQVRSDLVRLAT